MKNLILSAACGLDPTQIEFFLKSLRKHYDDEILSDAIIYSFNIGKMINATFISNSSIFSFITECLHQNITRVFYHSTYELDHPSY